MEFTELTYSYYTILSILGGITGTLGAYYVLKSKISILALRVTQLEGQHQVKEKKIELLENEVRKNQKQMDQTISDIKESMHEMEKRIIKAILEH